MPAPELEHPAANDSLESLQLTNQVLSNDLHLLSLHLVDAQAAAAQSEMVATAATVAADLQQQQV